MSFSINTNIASLQAQNYLRVNSDFQSKTINRVTSGLKIVNSGDDAAGLAVANGFRSDEAVLKQGIQNANDGLATLQTIDGGMSNISQLLDRARTLATQSASGTFTGDRSVLNSEFQSVLAEINRQAQSIGLNSGGTFAKSLSVFIGGGKGANNAAISQNGSVSVDLSSSTVDAKSLGLSGYTFQATPIAPFYIIDGGASGGSTTINFQGPGFSDTNKIAVSVNLKGVGDINALVNAINAGIQGAEQAGTPQAAAFQAANIVASGDSSGRINFTGSKAFLVTDSGVGASQDMLNGMAVYGYAQGTYRQNTTSLTWSANLGAADTQLITIQAVDSTGALQKLDVTLPNSETLANAITLINQKLQQSNNAALQNIVAVQDGPASLGFTSSGAFNLTVAAPTTAGKGITSGVGTTVAGTTYMGESTTAAAIDTIGGAQAAVSALATAVTNLGTAQAVVGKGENNFNYAVNLAQSQLTNEASAESSIRDADLATEAANLTKAQILLQAGVAALAQANAAPQAVLSLLKG